MMPRDREETGRRVVAFVRPARSMPADRLRPPSETGRILLFTGVRYQRILDVPAEVCGLPGQDRGSGDARLGG